MPLRGFYISFRAAVDFLRDRRTVVLIRDRRAVDLLRDCTTVDSIRGGLPAVYPNHES
jgi:hypothetical protein